MLVFAASHFLIHSKHRTMTLKAHHCGSYVSEAELTINLISKLLLPLFLAPPLNVKSLFPVWRISQFQQKLEVSWNNCLPLLGGKFPQYLRLAVLHSMETIEKRIKNVFVLFGINKILIQENLRNFLFKLGNQSSWKVRRKWNQSWKSLLRTDYFFKLSEETKTSFGWKFVIDFSFVFNHFGFFFLYKRKSFFIYLEKITKRISNERCWFHFTRIFKYWRKHSWGLLHTLMIEH